LNTDFAGEKLNELEYYGEPYPKSLGLEWVKKNYFL
jgi:hypothetical protein